MRKPILSTEDYSSLVGGSSVAEVNGGTGVDGESSNAVTYNEGNGVSDTILMTGPLSEVYTRALGVYFKKEPLDTVIMESQAIDNSVATAVLDSGVGNGLKEVADAIKLQSSDTFMGDSGVSATVFAVDQTMMNRPEVIEAVNKLSEKAKREGIDYVMAVNVSPLKENSDVFMDSNSCYYGIHDNKVNSENVGKAFTRATECYCESKGMNVVFGFEAFAMWLTEKGTSVKSTKVALETANAVQPTEPTETPDEPVAVTQKPVRDDGDHEYR